MVALVVFALSLIVVPLLAIKVAFLVAAGNTLLTLIFGITNRVLSDKVAQTHLQERHPLHIGYESF